MAEFDLTYYSGTDEYSDGDESENYLLAMNKAGKTLDDIPTKECTWPVFYHMSPMRENICNWYPFRKDATVLEIGAGCGAVTGILCQKAAHVTSIELSRRRATINYERNKKYSNLTLMVGNINDIPMEQKFDYVTLIGVLEYAGRFTKEEKPFQAFLESVKQYLKPDGILLIAIENRLGLKYFCGAAEDHTNQIYEGINNYPHYSGVRTFSKEEMNRLLDVCGLCYRQYYYPYPDYKLPEEIFTQNSLQHNKIPYITYDQDRFSLFCEADMFNQLTKEHIVDRFFNSFFIEASMQEIRHESQPEYCKLNQNRKPEFRTGTYICKINQRKVVKKTALHPAAQAHLQKTIAASRLSYGKIPAVQMIETPEGAMYPYNDAQSLEEIAEDLFKNDFNKVIDLLRQYTKQLRYDEALTTYDTPAFTQWFGTVRLKQEKVLCICNANVDSVLSNVLNTEDGFLMIDCEWVTDFPVPVDFLYWRIVYSLFVRIPELRQQISMEKCLQLLDVNCEEIPVFEAWEEHFQKVYVVSESRGQAKKNQLLVLEYGKEQRLNSEIARLNQSLDTLGLQNEIQSHQIRALQQQVAAQEKEVLRLKERVNYLVNCVYAGAQVVERISTYKVFKLVHLEKRIRHQLFSLRHEERWAFWRWLWGNLRGKVCTDHGYNPLFEVVDALYGPGDNQGEVIQIAEDSFWGRSKQIDIMTPGHTLYLAKQLANNLRRIGFKCEIHDEQFCNFEDIPYIVICAQIMKRLPQRYICYQMEQTINSRWLTEQYFTIMRNAYAVWDYSLVNISYFSQYPELKKKLYYVPLGITEESVIYSLPEAQQDYDILFYGDANCDRRRKFLQELQKEFSVRVESNLFGEAMQDAIRKSKIVINIHYYEDALLETTRVAEILSLGGSIVISERSNDPDEDNRMSPLVDFVEIGNIEAMKARIRWWLEHPDERSKKLKENRKILLLQLGDANFYFYRFMLANKQMGFDEFYNLTQQFIQVPQNARWCLHLPEQVERKDEFAKENKFQFAIFPGLRYPIGWVGCALSYKYMFKKLQDKGVDYAIICEDDVLFPQEFAQRFSNIEEYLSALKKWDVMSGFMADISDNVVVSQMDCVNGDTMLTINKMMSTVFNIYNQRAIQIGAQWDETNHNTSNTIDRYFESFDLKVILDFPYLVGHKENLRSILWDKNNAELYDELTTNTINKIKHLIEQQKQDALKA